MQHMDTAADALPQHVPPAAVDESDIEDSDEGEEAPTVRKGGFLSVPAEYAMQADSDSDASDDGF